MYRDLISINRGSHGSLGLLKLWGIFFEHYVKQRLACQKICRRSLHMISQCQLIKTLSIEDPLTANRRLLETQSGGILTPDDQVSVLYGHH
jgi:hypothetical protein